MMYLIGLAPFERFVDLGYLRAPPICSRQSGGDPEMYLGKSNEDLGIWRGSGGHLGMIWDSFGGSGLLRFSKRIEIMFIFRTQNWREFG